MQDIDKNEIDLLCECAEKDTPVICIDWRELRRYLEYASYYAISLKHILTVVDVEQGKLRGLHGDTLHYSVLMMNNHIPSDKFIDEIKLYFAHNIRRFKNGINNR